MNLFETIKARQSVRAYEAKPIEPAKLEAILGAANQAPSAGNVQAYQICVVRDAKLKRALAKAALDQGFIAQAPVVLVFCADARRAAAHYRSRGEQLYCVQDATIAAAYAQLAATALGLATCWVGAFDEQEARRIIGVPSTHRPVAIIPVGSPAETPERTPRRALGELVRECGPV
ncbi:MAG: nitroreductase family protein [Verrucomicrobia bacterium]|nr:nitroreductase family protein [Verrucomicrobiota bacterium]